MSARSMTYELMARIHGRTQVSLSFDDANTLRRAEKTLQRWGELECGDGNEWKSWAIERDEQTGVPYMVEHMHVTAKPGGSLYSNHGTYRTRIPDRERGALRRVADVCKRNGLHFFHQTDPRGCALYVAREVLTDSDYTRGIACCE